MDKSQASLEIDKHDIHLKNDIFDEKDFNLELNLENKNKTNNSEESFIPKNL